YVIGGDGVLSENVLKDLKTNNIQTERLSGLDRYSTNYAILNHFKDDIDFSNIYIANGQNFPDALSVSPLAAKENAPLIITNSNINNNAISLIKNKGYNNIKLVGGSAVVPDDIVEQIK
ncbi:cell wall-binding repeat-containing protein, partial [Clostridium botulinum]|uniref:cell wall-binding repeat-containing protein n=1 Tax=Clostridium botulinum TaxID=1491 RepID=UPI0004D02E2C